MAAATSLLIAAHLVAVPARYTVGKWSNISLPTMLAFNTANVGFDLLVRAVGGYVIKRNRWKISDRQQTGLILANRVLTCLAAWYATSHLKKPMPFFTAILSSIAGPGSIFLVTMVVDRFYPPKKKS